jgi:hypothetical protein
VPNAPSFHSSQRGIDAFSANDPAWRGAKRRSDPIIYREIKLDDDMDCFAALAVMEQASKRGRRLRAIEF